MAASLRPASLPYIDTADRLSAALPKYVLVVVGLALLLLTIVFRSILVPIKAAAGFLLVLAGILTGVLAVTLASSGLARAGLLVAGSALAGLAASLIGRGRLGGERRRAQPHGADHRRRRRRPEGAIRRCSPER